MNERIHNYETINTIKEVLIKTVNNYSNNVFLKLRKNNKIEEKKI